MTKFISALVSIAALNIAKNWLHSHLAKVPHYLNVAREFYEIKVSLFFWSQNGPLLYLLVARFLMPAWLANWPKQPPLGLFPFL